MIFHFAEGEKYNREKQLYEILEVVAVNSYIQVNAKFSYAAW